VLFPHRLVGLEEIFLLGEELVVACECGAADGGAREIR
jgi:hypothetical protein